MAAESGHNRIPARRIVGGAVEGPVLAGGEPISFLGDVDIRTGEVVGALPSIRGRCLAGHVLVVPGTGGSAGAWRFIHQLFAHRTHPLAIVSAGLPDPSVVQGAILAGIPVVQVSDVDDFKSLGRAARIAVDADGETVTILE